MILVFRDADSKGLWQIATEIGDLARRARARPGEMGGASMTITNLGSRWFSPIVTPP